CCQGICGDNCACGSGSLGNHRSSKKQLGLKRTKVTDASIVVDHSPGRDLLADCLPPFIHGHTLFEHKRSESGEWGGVQWFCCRWARGISLSRIDFLALAKL